MGRWTPQIIQGGKPDPIAVPDFLQDFINAGLAEQAISFEFLTQSLKNDATVAASVVADNKPDLPKMIIGIDEYGSPVMRFI